jgi:hypothetical protein
VFGYSLALAYCCNTFAIDTFATDIEQLRHIVHTPTTTPIIDSLALLFESDGLLPQIILGLYRKVLGIWVFHHEPHDSVPLCLLFSCWSNK